MIRKLPAVEERVETGPIQFGEDWPGTFIRGDNAFGYAMALEAVLSGTADVFARVSVAELLQELQNSNMVFHREKTDGTTT